MHQHTDLFGVFNLGFILSAHGVMLGLAAVLVFTGGLRVCVRVCVHGVPLGRETV